MTAKQYFLCSFFLPLIVPVPMGVILANIVIDSAFEKLLVIFAFSLPVGGLPYLIFLFGTLFWVHKQAIRRIQYYTWLAPPIYSLILILFWMIIDWDTRSESYFLPTPTLLKIGLSVGYFYVILVNLAYIFLKWSRLFQSEDNSDKPTLISIGLS